MQRHINKQQAKVKEDTQVYKVEGMQGMPHIPATYWACNKQAGRRDFVSRRRRRADNGACSRTPCRWACAAQTCGG